MGVMFRNINLAALFVARVSENVGRKEMNSEGIWKE